MYKKWTKKMRNRSKRKTHFSKHRKFIFTKDLNFIKPNADYDFCIELFISRIRHNDIIPCRNIEFALVQYKDFCPINILDDPYCLDSTYINENQRGKGYGRILMKVVLIFSN